MICQFHPQLKAAQLGIIVNKQLHINMIHLAHSEKRLLLEHLRFLLVLPAQMAYIARKETLYHQLLAYVAQ